GPESAGRVRDHGRRYHAEEAMIRSSRMIVGALAVLGAASACKKTPVPPPPVPVETPAAPQPIDSTLIKAQMRARQDSIDRAENIRRTAAAARAKFVA